MSGSSNSGGISQATADAAYIPKSLVTTADDIITASGASVPIRAAVAASRIVGKKASGGTLALTAAETLTVLGATAVHTASVPALYDANGLRISGTYYQFNATANTGAVTSGSTVYFAGSATASIGLIPRAACHLVSLEVCMSTLTTVGTPNFNVTVYKNSNVGGTSALAVAFTSVASGSAVEGYSTTILNSADAFNGSTDYYTIAFTVTSGTSATVGVLQVRLLAVYD